MIRVDCMEVELSLRDGHMLATELVPLGSDVVRQPPAALLVAVVTADNLNQTAEDGELGDV